MFEVENSYDYVWIDVTTDGGNVWSRIYGKSGYTEGMVIDYLDVSFLSGKDAIFKISLKSDSSFTGAGWDIKKFDVLSYVRYAKNEERKSQLRSGDFEPVKKPYPGQNGGETGSEGGQSGTEGGESGSEGGQSGTEENPNITIDSLKILNVQWESKDEGIISFSALDKNEEFVENIDLKDVKVVIEKDGLPIKEISGSEGCLSFDKTQSQRMVDIVLVVDYSTSMAGAIRNLRNSIFNMLQTLEHFDPRFSLIQYGIGNGLQKFYPNREQLGNEMYWVLDENNNYFYNLETLKNLFKLCTQCGCYEYAYDALMNAFNLQKYRPGASKVVILLYDQDGNRPWLNSPYDSVLAKLNDVQLFTITDINDNTNVDIQKLATSSGGNYANFQSSTNEELKIMIDDENVILEDEGNSSIKFRFVENNNGKNDTIWVSRNADAININEASFKLRSLYDPYDKYDACRILNAYANDIESGSYAFSDFAKKISDNLLNRHYLRISSKCFSETSLKCGENYSISIEINGKSDLANTKYVYPGAIVRDPETSKYDNDNIEKHCLESDFPVKFSIAGGCDNAVYGDAKVVYMYPDDTLTHTLDTISNKSNNYSTSIPLNGNSGIKYRIEVSQKDGNDVVFPAQYGFLDGFWNVYACNSGTKHPKIVNPKVECVSSGDTKQINFSVDIDNAVENGEVHLFFNSAGSDTSYAFDHIVLKVNEGTYSAENINLREGKEYFDYYVLYVDSTSKSILANYGNSMDNVQRVKVSDLKCKDVCHNISLSSHVLEEDNDVLSFDIYDDDKKVEILLCDTMGNKIIRQPIAVSSGDKEKSVSLISELDLRSSKYHLKYTMPYILVLKIGEKVHYMYVYLGRKKK
ncbi:MAG: vWA domain-containing protein [Paludibacteraceae bacterium]|nr:vWA domain-containing protein [Paludibacteraceae bacterium]